MVAAGSGIPQYTYVLAEAAITGAAMALAFRYARSGERRPWPFSAWFSRLARRQRVSIFLCALLPVVLRLLLLPWIGVPEPAIQEEFSYLLAADTFASGRLANPPHPMADHFDTYQVLQHPTYSSTRPPAQGLFLALGKVLAGQAWAGVCLSIALLCGATCWMLQGWFPPGWALLGGLLTGVRFGVFSYWMNSYWGGAIAAAGAALALGAVSRLSRRISIYGSFVFCAGAVLLFTTRAFEGLFILIPCSIWVVLWMIGSLRQGRWQPSLRFLLPAVVAGAGFITWTAIYNQQVTGDPRVPPYVLGRNAYNITPPFLFQKPDQPHRYTNEAMRRFYLDWELASYQKMRRPLSYAEQMGWRSYDFWRFYIRPVFTLPLLFIAWAARDRRIRLFLIIAAVAAVGQSVETWFPTYYSAPLLPVVLALVVQCLRHLNQVTWRGRQAGNYLVRAVPVIAASMAVAVAAVPMLGFKTQVNGMAWAYVDSEMQDRAEVLRNLNKLPGNHLALVRYSPEHNIQLEWVYNSADIDRSKVVWARDLGAEENEELLRYFPNRRVWLVEPDHKPPLVVPYRNAGVSYTPAPVSSRGSRDDVKDRESRGVTLRAQ